MNDRLQPLTENEVTTLLKGINSARDQAIVRLLLDSGLRIREIEGLNRDSIKVWESRDFGAGELLDMKSSEPRVFPVNRVTLRYLWAWLARRRDHSRALFVDSRGRRLSVQAMRQRLTYWANRLGLDDLSAYQLRRSFNARIASVAVPVQRRELEWNAGRPGKLVSVKSKRLIRKYLAEVDPI
jgi:integrase